MPSNPAFAIQLRFFCLTCAADLLENHAPGVQGNAAPSFKGDSVARKLVGSGRYSKCFFSSRLFGGSAIQTCNVARHSARRTFSAIKARGTPLRSDCGAIGASPAAAIN